MTRDVSTIIVDCPVCASDDHRILFRDRNRRGTLPCEGTYARCRKCGVVYLRERPPWDAIESSYSADHGDASANPGLSVWNPTGPARRPAWRGRFRKAFPSPHSWPVAHALPGQRILDVGCGSGAKLPEFAERGYEIWGIDVGRDSIEACRDRIPAGHFFCGELPDAGLPGGHFHFIRLDNSLEHVPDPKGLLRETHRILAPGGALFIYVPNGRSLSMLLLGRYSISSWIPFHLQLFDKASLERLLRDCGFEKVRIRGYTPLPWWPLTILQMIRKERSYRDGSNPGWLVATLAPLGWAGRWLGAPEEWVAIAKKR